jgi:hypothetical protein
MTGDTRTMKIPSTIISLLIAASVPLVASAAVAQPSSASSSLREAATAPIHVVRHRQSPQRHRVAPAAQGDNESYGAYSYYGGAYSPNGGEGVDDWSHWSPSHHPGWPCIGSGSEGNQTSAYPAWEMKPQCQ